MSFPIPFRGNECQQVRKCVGCVVACDVLLQSLLFYTAAQLIGVVACCTLILRWGLSSVSAVFQVDRNVTETSAEARTNGTTMLTEIGDAVSFPMSLCRCGVGFCFSTVSFPISSVGVEWLFCFFFFTLHGTTRQCWACCERVVS